MSSALEHEDLENVALVRMEDVQPSRDRIDRTVDIHIPPPDEEIFEYLDDRVEYDHECEIDDDSDSNIGSMVSIQSEEMVDEEEEGSDSGELIVPEVLEKTSELKTTVKQNQSDSWPTLEILPGGVIKNAVDCETVPAKKLNKPPGKGEMMYACAKCSQVFKYLFCLTKHVKWHEDQNKYKNAPHLRKMKKNVPEEYICLHTGRKKLILPDTKKSKRRQPKRLKSKS
ncbi:hypothetical protein PYW08_010345 [Mythimna loreyi]|uniref:Uncharacterized protein n=1 Tax=Mythimna loreyi TaxID=667449 RepID=A0ACC2Q549_9NEOP|nr:hypothetical protein PYW08_010345 [Mythimna loreyi]